MPSYEWLVKNKTEFGMLRKKLNVLASLGTPYTEDEIENAAAIAMEQARLIIDELKKDGVPESVKDKEIVALIAYLQRIGTDTKGEKNEVSSAE